MGRTRFRKSFKVAPGVKINLNKKSVGVTIGGKGARYTVNTSGQRTLSTGIPGTGLYFVETSKGKKGSGKSKKGNNSAGENSGNASEVNLYSMVNVHAREAKQRVKNCPVLGALSAALGLVFLICSYYVLGIILILLGGYIFKFLRSKYKKLAEAEENKLYELQQLLYGAESSVGSVPENDIVGLMVQKVGSALSGLSEHADHMDKAKTPEEFFDSYIVAKDKLNELIPFEPYFRFTASPSEAMKTLYGDQSTVCIDFVRDCYEKTEKKAEELVTERGRMGRYQRLYDSMKPYLDVMDKKSYDYVKDKCIQQGIDFEN